jgi:uncharacterized protein with FMN-binding domain
MYTIYLTEVALGVACTDDGVPAGQCTDDLAECTNNGGFKCSCKDGNYKSGSDCKAGKFDNKLCILYLKITLINVIPPNSDHRNCVHIKIHKIYHIQL